MFHKKTKLESLDATRASVQKEMAKPRVAKSARTMERKLHARAATRITGIVVKIIPSPHASQPEKVQITVEGSGHQHRDLRIENSLTDQNGHEVQLKKGARVRVTVAASPKPSIVS